MSGKTGRNDPCPCGSGKKFKRCCLARAEAERLETARQQSLLAPDDELDDDDFAGDFDEFAGGELPPSDFDTVERIRYERGFVQRADQIETGEGLRATEWTAPSIPQEILDSLSLEGIDELDRPWGHEGVGDPIQVDVIEIDFGDDAIVIEILNRATMLLRGGDEVARLHRACLVLEAATARGVDVPAGIGERGRTGDAMDDETPTFTLDDAVAKHRHQRGRCALCGTELTKVGALRHVEQCAPAHDARTGPEQDLLHLRVTAPGVHGYWLDLEVRVDAKLAALDSFLRGIWLECCGHLSLFDIGGAEYASNPDNSFSMFGGRQQRSMATKVGNALAGADDRFRYDYDFGSTTSLQLDVRGIRSGRIGRRAVRLVARNDPLVWPCAFCGEPAASVCPNCDGPDENPFLCATHAAQHACGGEVLLPVVNSPRMGVCAYGATT